MSEDRTEEIKKNILSPSQWIRILFMAFYAVICWVLVIVMSVIIIGQVIISLITGADNENLRTFGRKTADYFHQILRFMVYATSAKPWPFEGDSEAGETDDDDDDDEQPPAATTPSAAAAGGDDVFADMSFTEESDTETRAAATSTEADLDPDDDHATHHDAPESSGDDADGAAGDPDENDGEAAKD